MSKVIAQNFGGGGKILMGGKDYVTVWKKRIIMQLHVIFGRQNQ